MEDQEDNTHKKLSVRPAVSAITASGHTIELLYDPGMRTTSFAVWTGDKWSIEKSVVLGSGERLIPFSPGNNLIKNEAILLPSKPEEYGSEADLIAEIRAFIHRYVDLSPTFENLASYYVLFTWIHDAFNELPYLRFRGDYGTGKTRAILTIGSLCYKPFFASGASTVSPIFHTLDAFRGTLVFDEADFRFSDEKAEMVKILNNGNAKGMPVLRTVVTNKKEFDPRAFHVYGPKIVATRGTYNDRALESRFITEETGQRRLRTDIPINLPATHKEESLTLRNKLLLYRFRNRQKAKLNPALADPKIEPRLNQILVPLLSVISDPELHKELRIVAGAYHRDIVAERNLSAEAQVLEIVSELREAGTGNISVQEVTTRFFERHGAEYARPITNKWIGQILRTRLHLPTFKTGGVYVVPIGEAANFEVLRERYGLSAMEEGSESGTGT